MPNFDFPDIPKPEVYSIKITVPGEPVPKGRHRARIVQPRNKPAFIHFYQDSETEAYERVVAQYAKIALLGRGLILGALEIRVAAYIAIPASWSQKKKAQAISGEIVPVSRPDADNFLKCCLDAMNGVAYADDSQVIDMRVSKRYSETPRLEIEIFAA